MRVRVIGLRGWFAGSRRWVASQLGGGGRRVRPSAPGVLIEGTRCNPSVARCIVRVGTPLLRAKDRRWTTAFEDIALLITRTACC